MAVEAGGKNTGQENRKISQKKVYKSGSRWKRRMAILAQLRGRRMECDPGEWLPVLSSGDQSGNKRNGGRRINGPRSSNLHGDHSLVHTRRELNDGDGKSVVRMGGFDDVGEEKLC